MPSLNPFSGKKKSNDVVMIDINEQSVRIALGKGTSFAVEVDQIAEMLFPENAIEQQSKFINDFFKEKKIKDKRVFIVVSSQSFISKNVDIPSKDQEEIKKIIDLQAGRFTPYSRDEIVIDCFYMETSEEEHYTNVLLIIMNRKTIQRYYDVLNRTGVQVEKILIASEAMAITYSDLAGSAGREAVGGISIGSDSSDLTIADRGQLVFVRNLPIGTNHFKSNLETAKQSFAAELDKSLVSYKDQGLGRPLKTFYLAGQGKEIGLSDALLKDAVPFLNANAITIQLLDEVQNFQLKEPVTQILQEKQISFFDLFSAMKTASRLKIDLIPTEIKLKHRFRESGRDIITFGILVMTIFLMFSVFLVSKIYLRKEQIKRLDEKNLASEGEARLLEKTSTKSRVLRELLNTRGKGLYAFEKINAMVGEDIYLSSFSYDKEGKITFSGTAESMSRVFAFVTELEESNYFKDVKTNQTKSRREGQKEVADFEIACEIAEGL